MIRMLVLVVFAACNSTPAMPGSPANQPLSKVRDIYVNGPAGKLHVNDGGAGAIAIVFIPSLGGTLRQWQAQVDYVRQNHRAVVLELRGHGKSDWPQDRDYSLGAMAGDVDAVVSSLALPRFVLVGHSMGGGVALAYAAAHQDRVAGILLADPIDDPHLRPPNSMKPLMDRLQSGNYVTEIEVYWNRILEGARPDVKAVVLEDLRNTPRETVLGAIMAMANFNASAALTQYHGPIVSVITRFNDVPSALHKVSPQVRPVSLNGTSHWLQMDNPAAFNRVMDDFLHDIR
jgi:pimeloyl-ACP methyl ester carboxylesterase